MKVYNFSAGPSTLSNEVLLEAQKNFVDYMGNGLSVTEMSHRSKVYEDIHNECISLFRELMNIPENYNVLFLQGGASMQFEAVPLNLLVKGKADYIVTGHFAGQAFKQAQKFGDIKLAASSEDKNFTYIPVVTDSMVREDVDYVHLTSNNTIFGTRYRKFPEIKAPLVADMSSNILSEVIDVSKFNLIYAGAQKNIAPAGLTVVIVKKDIIDNPMSICPTMLKYKTQADNNSLYNTPPCFAIYIAMLTLRWLKKLGGAPAIQKINEYKSKLLYDFIDNSNYYKNPVEKNFSSLMNVTFTSPNKDLDAAFCKQAEANGLVSIKGHRLVGGMRASIYNAMPIEGVEALIKFMKEFQTANK
jgi:phosphoserine aminotransferase